MQHRTGYADVNGLHLYYEVHGEGEPVVLLHGGLLTIDLGVGELVAALAADRQVVALDQQGHGRTADVDREITPVALASDVVALLDHLGVGRADVLGHSLGAAVALELAVSHPGRVRAVVPVSGSVRADGMHEEITDPARWATSTRMPTADDFAQMRAAYEAVSPTPDRFDAFHARLSESVAVLDGWSDEQLACITAPVLIVQGDRDFITLEHAALMQRLVPGAQLAVLPGTTHMEITRRVDLLVPLLRRFLG